jgi:large subunit ribosomal protein L6
MLSLPYSVLISKPDRSLLLDGSATLIRCPFYGVDLLFLRPGLFFLSKTCYAQFLQLLGTLVVSVSSGYFAELVLVGLGFRLVQVRNYLVLKLGYGHYIRVYIPSSLIVIGYRKRLIVYGSLAIDVNQFVERVVRFRAPDIYKNKGVQVVGRTFRLKTGKQK